MLKHYFSTKTNFLNSNEAASPIRKAQKRERKKGKIDLAIFRFVMFTVHHINISQYVNQCNEEENKKLS